MSFLIHFMGNSIFCWLFMLASYNHSRISKLNCNRSISDLFVLQIFSIVISKPNMEFISSLCLLWNMIRIIKVKRFHSWLIIFAVFAISYYLFLQFFIKIWQMNPITSFLAQLIILKITLWIWKIFHFKNKFIDWQRFQRPLNFFGKFLRHDTIVRTIFLQLYFRHV